MVKIKPLKIRVLSCTCDWSVYLWQDFEQTLGISATLASCWEAARFLIFTCPTERANSHLEVWVSFLSVVPKQARCKSNCHTSVQRLCPAEHRSSKNLVALHPHIACLIMLLMFFLQFWEYLCQEFMCNFHMVSHTFPLLLLKMYNSGV